MTTKSDALGHNAAKSSALARVTLDLADLSDKLVDAENSYNDDGNDPTFNKLHAIIGAMTDAITEAIWELEA